MDGLWANVLGCELAIQLGGASVVVDTRRGDSPPGAGNYSFAAPATTESNIGTEPERIEAVGRGSSSGAIRDTTGPCAGSWCVIS